MKARPRVCVLGSANMDLVVRVDRAPRQGETVTGSQFEQVVGGKGVNQALAAARAGAEVIMLGAVGDDAHGAAVREVLAKDGIDLTGLDRVAERTGTAHITVDATGHNSIIVVAGANAMVGGLTSQRRAAVSAADVLLLQLELPLDVVMEAAHFARASGTLVVLTPAPAQPLPADLLRCVDLLVPNEHEVSALASGHDLEAMGSQLLAQGVGALAVTLGERGVFFTNGDSRLTMPAHRVVAVDTTGAGDTFVGVLATALAEGRPAEAALRWANAAAALSVQRFGASSSMPRRREIEMEMEEGSAG